MSKVLISETQFTASEQVIFSKAFNATCKLLGIADNDFTLEVRREAYSQRAGSQAKMAKLEDDRFLVIMNERHFNLFSSLRAFVHELIHIRQYLKGHMSDVPEGTVWKGRLFPEWLANSQKFYFQLPWEKEAHGNAEKLFSNVLLSLTEDERQTVMGSATPDILEKESDHSEIAKRLLKSEAPDWDTIISKGDARQGRAHMEDIIMRLAPMEALLAGLDETDKHIAVTMLLAAQVLSSSLKPGKTLEDCYDGYRECLKHTVEYLQTMMKEVNKKMN